jgi:hypothetical protein
MLYNKFFWITMMIVIISLIPAMRNPMPWYETKILKGSPIIQPLILLCFSSMALMDAFHNHSIVTLFLSFFGIIGGLSEILFIRTNFMKMCGRTLMPRLLTLLFMGMLIPLLTAYYTFSELPDGPSWASFDLFLMSIAAPIILLSLFCHSHFTLSSNDEMIYSGFEGPNITPPRLDWIWQSILQADKIEPGMRIAERGWFSYKIVRTVPMSKIWDAWYVKHAGDLRKARKTIGDDVASARQFASQFMGVVPEAIVVAPRAPDSIRVVQIKAQKEFMSFSRKKQVKREAEQLLANAEILQALIYPMSPAIEHQVSSSEIPDMRLQEFVQAIGHKTEDFL